MGIYLKQSTAVVISFGPFVDKTDGVTLITSLVSALDNGTTGIFLSKNGGTLTIRHATVTASTYDAYGNYKVTLDTTDTATLGTLRMQFAAAASCLPVWQDFMVVPAQVWDSLFGADLLQVDVQQFGNTNGTFTSGKPDVQNVAGNVTGSVGSVTGTVTLSSAERNSVADALLDRTDGIETGLTPRQSWRVALAATGGKVSGAATTTNTFRNAVADTKNRIIATVDSDGNRTAITYDLT